jgi:hypothetical protein
MTKFILKLDIYNYYKIKRIQVKNYYTNKNNYSNKKYIKIINNII